MIAFSYAATALPHLDITVNFEELAGKIKTGSARADILDSAAATLQRVNALWKPGLVYRWVKLQPDMTSRCTHIVSEKTAPINLHLGHSNSFLTQAEYGLIAAYTAGSEIERESQDASDNQNMFESFILDLIGLLVLEKTGNMVKQLAQEKAQELGWGVSPFLSPGSIHGWQLEEQEKLCSLLPLNDIGIHLRKDAVLMPFKSLSCLIGIGRSYEAREVGTTCQVCSKRNDCTMQTTGH